MIFELLPFDNELLVIDLKGSDIEALVRYMAKSGFWPVSKGLQILQTDNKIEWIKIQGQPLVPSQTYKVQMPDYVANGGEGTTFLANAPREKTGMYMREAVIEQLRIETKKGINDIQNGSSHLFRLYAFGKVMAEQVKIEKDSISLNQFIDLAKEANIVSPVSSLVVLETDNDYKNNAIEKNINTLGNASINDKPASPLPYQGVLLMLALLLGFSYFYRNKKNYLP
jgi:hypothetical protein